MTAYTFSEFIHKWWADGDFQKTDTLFAIRFVIYSRIGQLLQFFASLTIIAEVIGKEKVDFYREKFDSLINLKKLFQDVHQKMLVSTAYQMLHTKYYFFLTETIQREEKRLVYIIRKRMMFKYRRLLNDWLNDNRQIMYNRFRLITRKRRRNYNIKCIIMY